MNAPPRDAKADIGGGIELGEVGRIGVFVFDLKACCVRFSNAIVVGFVFIFAR